MYIESEKNSRIKNLIKLTEKSRERKVQQKIVIEGRQENYFAIQNNFQAIELYIQPDIFKNNLKIPSNVPLYEVSQKVYNKIAYRKITEGIIGIYQQKSPKLEDIKFTAKKPFILVVESIEKPGNLGAICRSADAFGVDLIIVCEQQADIYNPNVIRSSVGSVFNIPIISESNINAYNYLSSKGVSIFTTYMNETAKSIQNTEFKSELAIVIGTEHSGISDFWKQKNTQNILISMDGKIDSLNVSNAVAIICYEVNRQRSQKYT